MKFNLKVPPVPLSGWVTLILPFVAIALMVAQNQLRLNSYPEHRIKITGYDPRDLLTGHYLTFNYVWPKDAAYDCKPNSCYACYKKEVLSFTSDYHSCDSALKLETYGQTEAVDSWYAPEDLRRFNVSETSAPVLDDMLRQRNPNFEIGVVIYPDHSGQVKNLYIDGQPLADFLNTR